MADYSDDESEQLGTEIDESEQDVSEDNESSEDFSNEVLEPEIPVSSYNTIIQVPKDERRTSNKASKYEVARVLGELVTAIDKGDTLFVEPKHDTTLLIALDHIIQKKVPYIIRRVVDKKEGEIYVEEWDFNELDIPSTIFDSIIK